MTLLSALFHSSEQDGGGDLIHSIKSWLGLNKSEFFVYREFDQGETEIENLILEMLRHTDDYLSMSTELRPEYWGRDRVQREIEDVAERCSGDGHYPPVRILLDSGVDAEEKREEMGRLFDNPNIAVHQSPKHIPHWLISDGTDLRIEKLHDPGERGTSNLIIRRAEGDVSEIFIDKFNNWWFNSTSVK